MKKYLRGVSIVAIIIILIWGAYKTITEFFVSDAPIRQAEETIVPEPVVIPNTTGNIVVIDDSTGEEICGYVGTINILNDGTNGEDIMIQMHIPTNERLY